MYLTEVFFAERRKGVTVKEALTACDRELRKQMNGHLDPESMVAYFFGQGEPDAKTHFRELMEFWETFRGYMDQLTPEKDEEEDLFILQCVYEVDGIHHNEMCTRLTKDWSKKELKNLEALCNLLEGGHIFHSRYICFLEEYVGKWEETCRIGLTDYMGDPATFCYFAVRHRLIETMERGGLVIVTAGSRGLTPMRLVGCMLGDRDYRLCTPEELEPFREKVALAPNEEALQFFPAGRKPRL